MNRLIDLSRCALRQAALLIPLALAAGAQAGPVVFAPYAGSGNAVLFDALTGEGGWTGTVEQVPDIDVDAPLSLVSVVLFQYDAFTRTLMGQFEFTDAANLASSLSGQVRGSSADLDVFGLGGQLALDYDILGGTGAFADARGYGLAFLQFSPTAMPDNYAESGLLVFDVFQVPEPGSATLAMLGLLGLLGFGKVRRRTRPPV